MKGVAEPQRKSWYSNYWQQEKWATSGKHRPSIKKRFPDYEAVSFVGGIYQLNHVVPIVWR
jgi:hypothetical protein